MKMKFDDLPTIDSQPVPVKEARKNGDHAVITYANLRNQELNVSVSKEEYETIEFSQDKKYMQLPPFLKWVKGSKGPYLAHTNNTTDGTVTTDNIQW